MRLHHLALRATNVATTVAFYRDVLGLDVIKSDAHRTWFASGAVVIMVEPQAAEEPVRGNDLDLVAFAMGKEERQRWRDRLQSIGLTIEAETEHTFYLRDPDGRRVGLSSYEFEGRCGM
jgi:catechol 2,3-dioxygenase-like lactoylglutathione lyase family enzyme